MIATRTWKGRSRSTLARATVRAPALLSSALLGIGIVAVVVVAVVTPFAGLFAAAWFSSPYPNSSTTTTTTTTTYSSPYLFPELPTSGLPEPFDAPPCFNATDLAPYFDRPQTGIPLVLYRSPWQTHFITTALAATLLRDVLGYDVSIITFNNASDTSTEYERLVAIADINIEVWTASLNSLAFEQYFGCNARLNSGGALGLIGISGWYVPTAVVERYASLEQPPLFFDSWRSFTDPRVPAIFPRAGTTNDSLKAGQGREYTPPWCILATSPPNCDASALNPAFTNRSCNITRYNPACIELYAISMLYDIAILPQQVYQNRLNITVVFLGEQNFERVLTPLIATGRPILLYDWQPNSFTMDNPLTRVALPDFVERCLDFEFEKGMQGDGNFSCDFPWQVPSKVYRAELYADPDYSSAITLVQYLHFDTEEVNRALLDSSSAPANWSSEANRVTCAWLRNHSHVWHPWIRVTPSREVLLVPLAAQHGVFAFVIFSAIVSLVCHALVHWKRRHHVMRSSSVMFLQLIVSGSWFGYAGVLLLAYKQDTGVCSLIPALLSAAFWIMFGVLLLKTWRLSRIFHMVSLRTVRLSQSAVLRRVALMLFLEACLHLLWNTLDPPTATLTRPAQDAHTFVYSCNSRLALWDVFLFLPKVAALLYAAYVAYEVRHVSHNFNESQWIGIAVYALVMMGAALIPVHFFLSSQVTLSYVLLSVGITLAILHTLLLVLAPKFYSVFVGRARPPVPLPAQQQDANGKAQRHYKRDKAAAAGAAAAAADAAAIEAQKIEDKAKKKKNKKERGERNAQPEQRANDDDGRLPARVQQLPAGDAGGAGGVGVDAAAIAAPRRESPVGGSQERDRGAAAAAIAAAAGAVAAAGAAALSTAAPQHAAQQHAQQHAQQQSQPPPLARPESSAGLDVQQVSGFGHALKLVRKIAEFVYNEYGLSAYFQYCAALLHMSTHELHKAEAYLHAVQQQQQREYDAQAAQASQLDAQQLDAQQLDAQQLDAQQHAAHELDAQQLDAQQLVAGVPAEPLVVAQPHDAHLSQNVAEEGQSIAPE